MFKDALKSIVDQVEGGIAGLVMELDGIPVETYTRDGSKADLEPVATEFAHILGQCRKVAERVELGAVHEMTIKAEKLTLVLRVLSKEYFLALALTPDGNYGKGRFLMRVAAHKLQAEL